MVMKVIEILAESSKSWEDAAQKAVAKASETLDGVASIYIKDFSAAVENGKITQYRIDAKITFKLK